MLNPSRNFRIIGSLCLLALSQNGRADELFEINDSAATIWQVVDSEQPTETDSDGPIIVPLSTDDQFALGAGIRKKNSNQVVAPFCVAVVESKNRLCARIQYFLMNLNPKTDANGVIDYRVGAPESLATITQSVPRTPVGPVFQGYEFSPEKFRQELYPTADDVHEGNASKRARANWIWNGVMTPINVGYWASILSTKNQYDQNVPYHMLPESWKIAGYAGIALQASPYLFQLGRRVVTGPNRPGKKMYRVYLKTLRTYENWSLFLPSKKNTVSESQFNDFLTALKFIQQRRSS